MSQISEIQSTKQNLRFAAHQSEKIGKHWLTERVFTRLFSGLVYPQIWEDPVVDMEALNLSKGARILTISSGGCNALSYLTADPKEVIAVDLNHHHIHLLNLKILGLQHCPDHETFFHFFGRADSKANAGIFDAYLAPHLKPHEQVFWRGRDLMGRRRRELFEMNVYRHGLLGRFIRLAHFISRRFGVKLTPLLDMNDREQQAAYFEHHIAPVFDHWLIRFLTAHKASLFGLGIPPQQYDALAASTGGIVRHVLRDRTRKLFCDFPIAENYFAQQALGQRYLNDGNDAKAVPPYLAAKHFKMLQTRAKRVSAYNCSLNDHLAVERDGALNAFLFLDAQDWMNDAQLNALWAEVTRTAAPRARVVFRTADLETLLPGRVNEAVLSRWTYLSDASITATANDRAAIYGGVHVYEFNG